MSYSNNVVKIRGLAFWSKILGKPGPGYDPDIKSWSIDICPDAASLSKLQSIGLGDKVKDDVKNSHDGQCWINFKRRELKRDTGKPNQSIEVLDASGDEWDRSKLMGNGTKVEVDFNIYDIPAKGRLPAGRGAAILSVKVLELVEYEKPESQDSPEKPSRRNTVSSEESWSGDVA